MEVKIDVELLVRRAACMHMEHSNVFSVTTCIVKALTEQVPNIVSDTNKLVKEYKKLTMWRE